MSKHPGPWYLDCSDGISYVFDAYGRSVCATTADPETRVLLLHAQEMFAALRDIRALRLQNSIECHHGFAILDDLVATAGKIEAEIAAARRS